MIKHCSKCGTDKPTEAFNKNITRADGLSTTCRECNKLEQKAYYNKGTGQKEKQRERVKKRRKNYRKELNALMDSLKSKPCTDCKQCFDPICMDFDHLPRFKKIDNISTMIKHKLRGRDVILAEIAKCELVCANCHRLRTKKRGNF